ncbi:MAG TPA: FHA domain-containing protein [Gemmataceae bacterium]|nr:FHA domain-containing protein [Gemmataceae bacterium]
MSFRLFVYYCAVCGAWAAFLGWGFGRLISSPYAEGSPHPDVFVRTILRGLSLGLMLAFGLGLVDAFFSSRGVGAIILRGLFVAIIGLVSGLLGAAVGQGLYMLTESEVFRAFGWVLVGLLIGASVGVFDVLARLMKGEGAGGAVRKVINGVIGGGVGGLIGGILFLGLLLALGRLFNREDVLSSTAWGMVVLGACIGLFIGLAQVILKEAWVRVEAGFRPGRELILSKDKITIGRAESCDIGLFGGQGVEKIHARIVQKGKRYLLADDDTPGGTFLNDERISEPTELRNGDTIRVGNCVLRFGERQKN